LREYATVTNPREFLQARLERFGADTKGWEGIKRRHRTLVMLDGFDEISRALNPPTVTRNITDLLECCNAPVFEGCKLLIASRRHFFESRDSRRLLSRLDNPLVYRLARIPRGRVREHLKQGVAAAKQRALLRRIEIMHDPIGLASKPLFFQMVKETLYELPDELDEVTIYKGLRKK
jgi:hypothetical protein